MRLKELHVSNFRCFTSKKIQVSGKPQILIIGKNGAGKSSLLEALNFGCYGQAIRTKNLKEVVKESEKTFHIEIGIENLDGLKETIKAGFSQEQEGIGPRGKKAFNLNGKKITHPKEIIGLYKVASLNGNDLALVQGSPEQRRNYLNQTLFLKDPALNLKLRSLKKILSQRGALFIGQGNPISETMHIWTKQLWISTIEVQKIRIDLLEKIKTQSNQLLQEYFGLQKLRIELSYKPKAMHDMENFASFWNIHTDPSQKYSIFREALLKRNLFGAHLDDFTITLHNRCARTFASRGEQKLITFLMKVAQLLITSQSPEKRGIILLDDFLTDFDEDRMSTCLKLLIDFNIQAIITTPTPWPTKLCNEKHLEAVLL